MSVTDECHASKKDTSLHDGSLEDWHLRPRYKKNVAKQKLTEWVNNGYARAF